jgi:cell division protein ZapE
MWGGVGRGKTYLMDVFFNALPFADKERMHFHRFMQYVHKEMRARQGEKNPLDGIARDFAKRARVLCFDEFFVTDITDAMILATILGTLFKEGVTLVTTSNIVPDELYRDGLQRARFLPAIALLKQHTKVLNVDGGTDYRLRLLEQAELYHCPLGVSADTFMAERFATLETGQGKYQQDVDVQVEGRPIRAHKVSDDVAWFEFRALCDGPRSQNDYIELAREYHTVLLANVERMGGALDDIARRFINLVDEFYDRGVKLIITAEVPIEDIYAGGRLDFEFARTCSRLLEMQSHEYLSKPHLA